jgi:mycoredoxin
LINGFFAPPSLLNRLVLVASQLAELGISFTEVDIEQSPEAAALVESLNNGNQMVPTLVFSDGTSITNPSAMAVKEKLGAL